MESHKYIQPELELRHNSEKSQKNREAIHAVGKLALETVVAIGNSFRPNHSQEEAIPHEDRLVIDLIEDSTVYGSIMSSDGNEHQLVLPLDSLHFERLED
ncbi:MAG: hypothetical protein WCI37_01855 [bacterium]